MLFNTCTVHYINLPGCFSLHPTALSLDEQIGNFVVGKDFDALRVNVCVPDGPIDLFSDESPKV